MTVNKIFSYLEKAVAPVALSDEFCKKFDMYDNSGIIVNCGGQVSGALFCLDLTEKTVNATIKKGFNLIITHHPAIYGGISRLDLTSNPQAKAIAECIKNGVSVISMHLNFDAAPQGIDYHLMCGLGGKNAETAASLSGGGYGRVYNVKLQTLDEFVQNARRTFETQNIIVYGDISRKVTRVASFCGAGCDDFNMDFAVKNGADVFVSSDMKHHEILALTQNGVSVMELTHYASENYGFKQIYYAIKDGLGTPSVYFTDSGLL